MVKRQYDLVNMYDEQRYEIKDTQDSKIEGGLLHLSVLLADARNCVLTSVRG